MYVFLDRVSPYRLVSEERYLEDRISHVERNFAALATDMGGMVRRTARLRDKGDKIVKTFQDFASNESGSMKKSLDGLAECCSALEDGNQFKVSDCSFLPHLAMNVYRGVCRVVYKVACQLNLLLRTCTFISISLYIHAH